MLSTAEVRGWLSTAHLDWFALALVTVGTAVWAHGKQGARYTAAWWRASSVVWMAFSWARGLPALGLRDGLNVMLYGYAGWNAWVRDHRKNSA